MGHDQVNNNLLYIILLFLLTASHMTQEVIIGIPSRMARIYWQWYTIHQAIILMAFKFNELVKMAVDGF